MPQQKAQQTGLQVLKGFFVRLATFFYIFMMQRAGHYQFRGRLRRQEQVWDLHRCFQLQRVDPVCDQPLLIEK